MKNLKMKGFFISKIASLFKLSKSSENFFEIYSDIHIYPERFGSSGMKPFKTATYEINSITDFYIQLLITSTEILSQAYTHLIIII